MRKFTLSLLVIFVSVIFMVQSAFSQDILVVDRDGSADLDFTDCWPYFMDALDANGYTYTYFEVTDMTMDGPDLATMQNYDIVIWFTGESWTSDQTMTNNDETNLADYLDGGGNLFFSGQDFLWDRWPSAGTLSSGDFPYDYFGLTEVAQDIWFIETTPADINGVTGSLAEGYMFQVIDIFTTTRDGLYIDEIVGTMGMNLFEVATPSPVGNAAVQFDGGDFKTVFTTVSFAAITDAEVQADLMMEIVDFLYASAPPSSACENFDSYNVGDYVAENIPGWTTWSGSGAGTDEDATISDDFAYSAPNSMVIEGVTDLVQLFADETITTGKWHYSNMLYVPSGNTGYFNLQKTIDPGEEFGFQIEFNPDGSAYVDAGAENAVIFPFDFDTWNMNELIIDLDADYAEYWFNGELMIAWAWSLGTFGTPGSLNLGGVDYYALATDPQYFDDVCFEEYVEPADCEDFDALTPGDYVAGQLGGYWTTWGGNPGGSDDALVSDTYSNSPSNSFVVDDGAVDLVFQLGDEPIDAGQWMYSHYFYVPTGFSGYFNVQTEPTPGVDWNLDVFLNDGGEGELGTQSTETFTYMQDTWVLFQVNYDFEVGLAEVWIDGEMIAQFENEYTIGGIDYYGLDSGGPPGAYYDDVCFGPGYEIIPPDCENFDALTAGEYVAGQLGGYWTTWSGAPGTSEDALVSDMFSNSPSNSFVVNDGGIDLVFQLGDEPISEGQWMYSHYIYVPTGNSGYFNVQTEPTAGVDWNLDVFFNDGGEGELGTQSTETFTYAQDTWLLFQVNYDLDHGFAEVWIDGELITQFVNEYTIGGIDYYGLDSGGPPGAYYDDVCFGPGYVITSIDELSMEESAVIYPNPARDQITIQSENIIDEVVIYNNMGQLVYSGEFDNDQITVNTSSFTTGMYIVQIRSDKAIEVRKLIIE